MDQVKSILKVVQKHHFWLLSVVAVLAAVVGWYMARNALSDEYTKNKGTIVGKFTALQGILSTQDHPNNTWTEEINKLTAKEKDIVRNAWQKLYDEQKKNLEWPPELGENFLKFVESNPPTAEIHRDLLSVYQDRIIKSEFPRLLAIVDARSYNTPKAAQPDTGKKTNKGKADASKKAGPPAEEPPPIHDYKVEWDETSQKNVEKLLDFAQLPTSAEVRQAQEDIWIYKALLTIIRAMNTEQRTSVRKISEISIGPPATAAFQSGMSGDKIVKAKASGPTESTPPPPPPLEGAGPTEKPIDENRYVEADGKPLAPGTAAAQQFKRLPIVMRLSMDQRDINKLLVECANSQLPVEVRQLRINASKGGITPKSGSSGPGKTASVAPASESEFYDVPIEIVGIIYLYNPPDMSKLGIQPAAAGAAAGGQ